MKNSARQSMAWLHSWVGLLFGWILFAIFLTGSLSYYRHEINIWSQPQLANIQVHQKQAVLTGLNYLEKHAPKAKSWYLQVANENNPINKIYWQTQDGTFNSKTLDPNTAQELNQLENQAGEFLYLFHFQLYGMPILTARLIVSCAAFMMLISLISGIITHKKIFTDFFTLRTFKGQRSYLDFHNVSSVIALPFFLTITFTGLAILFYLFLPLSIQKTYPKNIFQFFDEIRTTQTVDFKSTQSDKMLTADQLLKHVKNNMGDVPLNIITVKEPNTSNAVATFNALEDKTITQNVAQTTLNAVTGEILSSNKNKSAIATLSAGVYGIHMMTFAQPLLRISLFISGLLGCAMIGSGLLLWSLKRQLQQKTPQFNLGHYLVNRLNMTAILGLSISLLCYLMSYRINSMFDIKLNEIHMFFTAWCITFLLALFIFQTNLWKTFLKVFIALCTLFLIIDFYYFTYFFQATNTFNTWKIIRVDVFILTFTLLGIFLHQKIEPIQNKAVSKIQMKLHKKNPTIGDLK